MPLSEQEFAKLSPAQQKALAGADDAPLSEEEFLKLPQDKQLELAGPPQNTQSPGKTFVDNAGNSAMLGYMPEAVAGISRAVNPLVEFVTGQKTNLPSYTQIRDGQYKELAEGEATNPKAALGGKVAGALAAGIPLGGAGFIGKGASFGGRAIRSAGVGGALGFTANPGAVEGEVNPLQLADRGKNAITGAALGGAAQGAAEGVAKIATGAKGLKGIADRAAFKATGARTRDFAKADSRGVVEDIGQVLREEGIVGAGSTPRSVVAATQQKLDEIGPEIGAKILQAEQSGAPRVNIKAIADKVRGSFDTSALKKTPGRTGDVANIEAEIETLLTNGADLSLTEAQALKRNMDGALDAFYKRLPEHRPKATEDVLLKIRNQLRDAIVGSAGPDLKPLLTRYARIAEAKNIASKAAAREAGNNYIGVRDAMLGGGAGLAAIANNPEDPWGAIGRGFAVAGVTKAARTFGPGFTASLAGGAAKGLSGVNRFTSPVTSPFLQKLSAAYRDEAAPAAATHIFNPPRLEPALLQKVADQDSPEIAAMKRRQKKGK
jgi:ElaB/YqjD/DUF883 family membrane-anchored ribosome-binding protein